MKALPLRATQRLQFHKGFTLDDAVALVPYFARLGISHLYASPLLSARAGSMHGYDVVDPTTVNPELGGEAALRRLVAALREHDMGLILDIVSNHMAVGGADNPWWLDLLEWGRLSPYCEFFDIQWHSPDPLLKGQLLMPFLGCDYGEALQAGTLTLHFDAAHGSFSVEHYEHRFPICPQDYATILGADELLKPLADRFSTLAYQSDAYAEAAWLKQALAERATDNAVRQAIEQRLGTFDARQPEGFQRLHGLLEQQAYRLASWRTAADDINWRRFFDVNDLGGLRVERSAVFEATHGKIFELISQGLVDGLRIDHIDGLADPRGYCRKLRRRVDTLSPERHLPIFVEKILGEGETLREDWQVDGTTGYEFMNQLSLLQHRPQGFATLAELWTRHSERPSAFIEEAWLARRQILNGSLAGDFESVAQALLQVARDDVMSRDLTLGAIRRALQELIVHFPVYRTYISACGRSERDDTFFLQALAGARSTLSEGDWPVLDNLEKWLGGQPWRNRPLGRERKLLKHACVRFQQLTSPAAAKAVEDTAFYRSAVLLSRNDVGFSTEQFSAPLADFHAANQQRLQAFPDNLLATATHDHKRGEDSRARLAVLSECAGWYAEQVTHWRRLAAPLRNDASCPSAGDELILYQVLLGSWPLDLHLDDRPALEAYQQRLWQWQQKALREAKLQSSWSAPNEAYEQGVETFLTRLLLSDAGRALRTAIGAAAQAIAPAGALNGLAQSLLRVTVPGVPDLYQGNEFWDFSLVDPDNRRPVDFNARQHALATPPDIGKLLFNWRDGRIKQALIAQVLALRKAHPELFHRGSYTPLDVVGRHAEHVVAFCREYQGKRALVVVPRWPYRLLENGVHPQVNARVWGDTRVKLPFAAPTENWKGLFHTRAVTPDKELLISTALGDFPVNVFIDPDDQSS
ncbi:MULTISPECIES: malto-oligosyltrehalose synthase [Pseudomonas]|jgi:(1->4)-alpha-D-glucan 1-alpha-D-glucosylmutase|uniref:Malto-oligosyltrehalose synthase n=1 Tax=Pseudomonas veronii TaxID=76761 RepID=A0A7Y1A3K5_PSEVE|nr:MULTISPECIES: malto-oligosyltrehalose synthase [Pseudomonas]NMY08597.1 malto-oligosyltrehalose synthase [Pseudomonas veronii]PMU88272.1 malto-oligosyltrehalose synthase [Pseudomonas sp. GW704-F3]PMU97625.1 malto-oligosyltrehalose synthase [Pseudomonas sp. GW704-F5]PMV08719.1 malto-oligosyltrehalose synthase [Pseudomonas sp. MPBD4-3]PMV35699.1 malto-oligosyltrehalose synthase [Pseudomonas sp. GW704-F2]